MEQKQQTSLTELQLHLAARVRSRWGQFYGCLLDTDTSTYLALIREPSSLMIGWRDVSDADLRRHALTSVIARMSQP